MKIIFCREFGFLNEPGDFAQTGPVIPCEISREMDDKIPGMYGLGMSYSDLQTHLNKVYVLSVR